MYLACLFVLLLYEYEYKYEALILLMGRLLLRKKYFAENGKTSQNPKNQTEPDLYSDSYSDCDSDSDSDSDSDPEWATSRHSDGFVAAICVLCFMFDDWACWARVNEKEAHSQTLTHSKNKVKVIVKSFNCSHTKNTNENTK